MIKKEIESIAYLIKSAKKKNNPMPIVFIGAGASISAGIPGAGQIAKDILKNFRDKPGIRNLKDEKKDYYNLMKLLNTDERHELLRGYITNSKVKINVTHIYLAQLLKEGFLDYILTVNFDDLILRAAAMFNFIPPVYDIAVLKDFTTTTLQEKSVTYLHGQHHGFWLLNTDEELEKVNSSVPKVLNRICNKRTWIIVGYSGEDPIFDSIVSLGRFDNDLYWVGYKDHEPSHKVQKNLLNQTNTNAFYISDYDSDSFFLKLHSELNLETPKIFNKPFSFLNEFVDNIKDIESEKYSEIHKELFNNIIERFETSVKWVKDAINKYEEGGKERQIEEKDINIDILKQKIIEAGIKKEYSNVIPLYKEVLKHPEYKLNNLISRTYISWGNSIFNKARLKSDKSLYKESIEKYKTAVKLNSKNDFAFCNWGLAISKLAKLNNDKSLYKESFEKYKKALKLNPKNDSVFYNWGNAIYALANLNSDESLYKESFEKYKIAAKLNSKYYSTYNNWGIAISELAKLKSDESLYKESFEKYKTAAELNSKNDSVLNNWGNALTELARLKSDESLYKDSFEKYKTAAELNQKNEFVLNNWGVAISDLAKLKNDESLYKESFEKYKTAVELNQKYDSAFNNWGNALIFYSRILSPDKKSEFLLQAIEKCEKAREIIGYSYNLSCVYALLNEKEKALQYLEESFIKGSTKTEYVLTDEDWKDYLEDKDFKKLIDKYKDKK